MKINIRIPDWINELVTAEARRDEVSKNFVIITALKERYRKQSPDVRETVKADRFWPSGWPRVATITPHVYCDIARGPWCNLCDREHDPMEHEKNDDDTLKIAIRRHELGLPIG